MAVCIVLRERIHYYSWARIFRRLFSKRRTFGSKSGNKTKTIPEHLKVFHIWLIHFFIFFFLLLNIYLLPIGKFSLLKRDNWIMWIKNIKHNNFLILFYKPNMTDLQMLGNSFCEFGLVSKYQRFNDVYWPKSAPFWKLSSEDTGPAVLGLIWK